MERVSLTELAHRAVASRVSEGDCVVDATAGTGRDCLFLAEIVGEAGHVYAFDVQVEAVEMTRQRLARAGLMQRVSLINAGHERMEEHLSEEVRGRISAVMFNLGYLPGANHALTTMPETTVAALEASMRVLAQGGILSVLCYRGHEQGGGEYEAVLAWADSLAEGNAVAWQGALSEHTVRPSPRLLTVLKG